MFAWLKADTTTAGDLYMDLGTANTLISARNLGVILNEPSLVAYQSNSQGKKKVVAVGFEAQNILEKNPGNIFPLKPVRDGVIADFDCAEIMLKYFLSQPKVKKAYPRPRVVVSLPYGVTDVEKKAVVKSCKSAGAKEVFLIDEPMAAAIGAGLPIQSPNGNMIVDIGGGTTEVAIIALCDIVYCEPVRIGGHKIDEDIISHFKRTKKIIINEKTAEHLKIELGTAVPQKNIHTLTISGRDLDTGLVKSLDVTSEDVGIAMNSAIQEIVNAIHRSIENTPPELVADVIESGITLAGGGALIHDLDLRIQNEVRLPVRIAENPLLALAVGGEHILKNPDLLEKIKLDFET